MVLLLVLIGFIALQIIRSRRWSALVSEEGMLATARRCAGEEGTVVQEGPFTVWYSGPEDPLPMLREAIAGSHRRFASLLGESEIADPPIRFFLFHDRGGLLGFYKAVFPSFPLAEHPGVYFQRPFRIVTLCTGEFPGRLNDPRSLAGSLYDLVLVEHVYGVLPAPWLQAGLARALSAREGPGELARLNRKMVAAMAVGAAEPEDLFSTPARRVSRWLRNAKDTKSHQKSEQFIEQSWSILEYLGGEQAPEDRRAAFRAFLKDPRSRSHQAESFFRHFGFGFGSLLDDWRQRVLDRGTGPDEPPPPRVRDGIVHRLLPVIRDRGARPEDRVRAIREWRKAGYPMGADALIDRLREPGEIPREEIVWALRSVSGMTWGDEPERWRAWWDDLAVPEADALDVAT
jgi:hypothetical protein